MAIRDRACVDFDWATDDFAALLSAQNLDREAARIDMRRAAPWPLKADKGGTVWMGAIDGDGLAVSFIQSVYWDYGSGCVLPQTGVLMQNRGVAFSLDPQARNPLTPGRRPFHTLNPALAVFERRPRPRLRLEGGRRPAAVPGAGLYAHRRWRAARRSARRAAPSLHPRLHGEPAATVKLEEGYDESTAAALAAAGHAIERRARGRARHLRPRRRGDALAQRRDRRGARPALRRRRGGNLSAAAAFIKASSKANSLHRGQSPGPSSWPSPREPGEGTRGGGGPAY